MTLTKKDIMDLMSLCDKAVEAIEKEAESDNLHDHSAYEPEIERAKELKAKLQSELGENKEWHFYKQFTKNGRKVWVGSIMCVEPTETKLVKDLRKAMSDGVIKAIGYSDAPFEQVFGYAKPEMQ